METDDSQRIRVKSDGNLRMMIRKLGFSLFFVVFLYMGVTQLDLLLHAPRSEGQILSTRQGRKNSKLATVRFATPDGRSHQVEVNAEGHQVGESLTIMYRQADPEGTANAYSPLLYVIPFVCIPFALSGLAFLWPARKKAGTDVNSQQV